MWVVFLFKPRKADGRVLMADFRKNIQEGQGPRPCEIIASRHVSCFKLERPIDEHPLCVQNLPTNQQAKKMKETKTKNAPLSKCNKESSKMAGFSSSCPRPVSQLPQCP